MRIFAALLLLITSTLAARSEASSAVTYISHEKVAEALAKGGRLLEAGDLRVQGGAQVGSKEGAEVHEKMTHVFYVIDGTATMVTGGILEGAKLEEPGQIHGTGIRGGQAQKLSKGDVIVIPAGTPHWWKDVPQSIHYYVVNVLRP